MHDVSFFGSTQAQYFVICCREGSIVANFWLVMSVPSSHFGTVTVEKVSRSLQKGLKRYAGSDKQMGPLSGYIFHPPSLSVTGENKTAQHMSSCSRMCFFLKCIFCSAPYRNWFQSYRAFKSLIWYHTSHSLFVPNVFINSFWLCSHLAIPFKCYTFWMLSNYCFMKKNWL